MSFNLMQLACDMDACDLTGVEKSTLVQLARYADECGHAFPTIKMLSEKTGFKDRSIRYAVQSLVEKGFIAAMRKHGGKLFFTINISALNEAASYADGSALHAEAVENLGDFSSAPHADGAALHAEPVRHHVPVVRHHMPFPKKKTIRNHLRNQEEVVGREQVAQPTQPIENQVEILQNPKPAEPTPPAEPKKAKRSTSACVTTLDFSTWHERPSDETLLDWQRVRKAQRKPITQTAINRLAKEVNRAKDELGMSADDVVAEMATSGWQGFKVDWMLNRQRSASGSQTNGRTPMKTSGFTKEYYMDGLDEAIASGWVVVADESLLGKSNPSRSVQ